MEIITSVMQTDMPQKKNYLQNLTHTTYSRMVG